MLFVPRLAGTNIKTSIAPRHIETPFFNLPQPTGKAPYHLNLSEFGVNDTRVFHVVGDTGDSKNTAATTTVALAMEADFQKKPEKRPSFLYHLGDVEEL